MRELNSGLRLVAHILEDCQSLVLHYGAGTNYLRSAAVISLSKADSTASSSFCLDGIWAAIVKDFLDGPRLANK